MMIHTTEEVGEHYSSRLVMSLIYAAAKHTVYVLLRVFRLHLTMLYGRRHSWGKSKGI